MVPSPEGGVSPVTSEVVLYLFRCTQPIGGKLHIIIGTEPGSPTYHF